MSSFRTGTLPPYGPIRFPPTYLLLPLLLLISLLLPSTAALPSSHLSSHLSIRSAETTKIIQDGMPPTPTCGNKHRLKWICESLCHDKDGTSHDCKDLDPDADTNAATQDPSSSSSSQYGCVTVGVGRGSGAAALTCLTVEAVEAYLALPKRYQCDC